MNVGFHIWPAPPHPAGAWENRLGYWPAMRHVCLASFWFAVILLYSVSFVPCLGFLFHNSNGARWPAIIRSLGRLYLVLWIKSFFSKFDILSVYFSKDDKYFDFSLDRARSARRPTKTWYMICPKKEMTSYHIIYHLNELVTCKIDWGFTIDFWYWNQPYWLEWLC